jgi:hypothetical protein
MLHRQRIERSILAQVEDAQAHAHTAAAALALSMGSIDGIAPLMDASAVP